MNDTILLYNQKQKTSKYSSFANTEAILKYTSETKKAVIHFWTTEPTVILGMQDLRLSNLSKGLIYLKEQQYDYFVRNSGGLGVVSDDGVLNFTICLPSKDQLSIDAAYELMYKIIRETFNENIVAGEIENSYCPGTYDLSINGKKIAGLSQRRVGESVAIMAYISICGDQNLRSNLMQNFYQLSNVPINEKIKFPVIDPECMENLDSFDEPNLTIYLAKQKIIDRIALDYNIDYDNFETIKDSDTYIKNFKNSIERIEQKNLQQPEV
ncbi:lipoate--protein ligase family protein [Lactobacillus terrae]|uniref:lipoate--protein ligase family protein n=1 Tax=Lactobacillus terrae TaxID=2269374 RepID=UPI000C1B702C|nr:lipoate--protein ligase family protein [Lactobacillus terrae]